MLRALLAAPALLFCTALADDASPAKAQKSAKREYVRYVGDDKRGRLETAVVTLKKGGVQVELVGAVHVADPEYYKSLTSIFAGYEELLFELVDGQKMKQDAGVHPKPATARKPPAPLKQGEFPPDEDEATEEKERSPAFKIISAMMHGVGTYFHFQHQTDGIDYHTKNFVHADVSMDEFVRLQVDKGESFLDVMRKAIEAQLEIGSDRKAEPKGSQLLLALLGDSSGLKVAMARQLASAGDVVTEMEKHDGGTVIITERNRKALEVFDREVAAGRKNLGIFYGAAHLTEMEKDLEKRGYHRTGERWLTAWEIKPRVEQQRPPPSVPKE
ncbi:MAG: hypothetical protein ABIP20_18030 [Chthoniobacteraceae bacterium]